MQGYSYVCKWTLLRRTSPEVLCLHPTSSRREMCTFSVSNVIYHKFSHGAAFYTLNGKNVNVILEYSLTLTKNVPVKMPIKGEWVHFQRKRLCIFIKPSLIKGVSIVPLRKAKKKVRKVVPTPFCKNLKLSSYTCKGPAGR